ncbi:PepSY-associated TM helix domain-containing protein [Achromobacter denitrificans]|uniref:PepSY-associated TM helix domain-containing protein n=1 Tax=Achromobacter denitrificans TaxID=32002 RepID=UPI003CFE2747
MRPDAKPEGLRQAMSWLHTWSGLVLGWLLFAVFLLGTLSFARTEITAWMQPEVHGSRAGPDTLGLTMDTLARIAPAATVWSISLPGPRDPAVRVSWREPGAAAGRAGLKRAVLDAGTGEVLEPRATRGGDFLYRFHFELYGMPQAWARWIVGAATLFMLVAIVSGVITHKKIFTDFFTFRPRKGQRSWLDGHNATAVLALPFNFVITFSGLLLLMYQLMPWPIEAAYQGDTRAYFAERRAPAAPVQAPGHDAPVLAPPRAALQSILDQTAAAWPDSSIGALTVNRPGGHAVTVEAREGQGASLVDRGVARRAVFDAASGARLDVPAAEAPTAAVAVYNVFTSAHLGRFAGPALRWLLFLSGTVGSFMVASGMVLWVVKRLPERRKLGRTPKGHRLVEATNVAALAGLFLAIAAYFWMNRLLPASLAGRADWEIRGFFAAWALSLAYACLRTHRRAWIDTLALSAGLLMLLPALNAATGGTALPVSIARGLWSVAAFDLSAFAMGALLAFMAFKLSRSGLSPASRLQRKPPSAAPANDALAAGSTNAGARP